MERLVPLTEMGIKQDAQYWGLGVVPECGQVGVAK